MKLSESHEIHRMGARARAAIEAAELHYRADFAEALLSDRKPPKRDPEKRLSAADSFLAYVGKIDDKQRKKLVDHLLTADLLTRKLTRDDRAEFKRLIQPGADTPMLERTSLPKNWGRIFAPDSPISPDDPGGIFKWQQGVLRDFFPDMLADGGRPVDQDDGPIDQDEDDPSDSEDTPTDPVDLSYSDLRFVVDRVTCGVDTREVGRDEINYSGIATEGPLADFVQPSTIGASMLAIRNAGQFRFGDTVDESPRGPMHIYDLTGHTLPRLFIVHLTMAEIDGGGFAGFMTQFMDDLTAELTTNWELAVGVVLGMSAAGALGGLAFGPIGAAIGAAIGLVVGITMVALSLPNQDEIFEHRSALLVLEPNALQLPPFNGSRISDTLTETLVNSRGRAGRYDIDYHWELVGGSMPPVITDQDEL